MGPSVFGRLPGTVKFWRPGQITWAFNSPGQITWPPQFGGADYLGRPKGGAEYMFRLPPPDRTLAARRRRGRLAPWQDRRPEWPAGALACVYPFSRCLFCKSFWQITLSRFSFSAVVKRAVETAEQARLRRGSQPVGLQGCTRSVRWRRRGSRHSPELVYQNLSAPHWSITLPNRDSTDF